MKACRIASYLHAHLPADLARRLEDHVDIIPAVESVNFREIGGLEHLGVVEFNDGLNVICGVSGSGVTRVLDGMKTKAYGDSELPPLPSLKLDGQSCSQIIIQVVNALLEIQPPKTCLLLDDVFDLLPDDDVRELISVMSRSGNQVVVSCKPSRIDVVQGAVWC